MEINTVYDLADLIEAPSIVQQTVKDRTWGNNERTMLFLGILNTLDRWGIKDSVKSKRTRYPIGDHPSATAVLSDTFTVAGTYPDFVGSDTTIKTTEARYTENTVFYLYDSNAGEQALVRLDESGKYTSKCTILKGDARVFATATTAINVTASAHKYERTKALDYITFKGTLMSNSMQATRSQVASGKYENSEALLIDNSLDHKMALHWKDFQKRMCNSLLTNRDQINPELTDDFGMSQGLPGALIVGQTVGSETYKGTNVVSTSTGISHAEIRHYLSGAITDKGASDKIVYCSADVANKFFAAFDTAIERVENKPMSYLMPEYQDVWSVPYFNLGFCGLYFVIDKQIGKISQTISGATDITKATAGTVGTASATGTKYMIFLDPTMIGITYMEVEGEGVKTPQIRPVKGDGNDNTTIDRKEIEAVWSFEVREPTTCGYFFFGGTAD